MRLLLSALPLRSPLVASAVLILLSSLAQAQAQSEPTTPAPAPAPAPAPTATRPGAQPADLQRVQITGSTAADADTLQRQQSTASKIIIGREEIDRYGDSNVGEVLKRLPGVTTGGAPGRGGPPRMRGMGGGYTQILINGEPIPQGFSLESLTPEQVERIEILRAPTAEFGARAIAGTINVVLREALQKRLNDLRFGVGTEGGLVSPGISWTRNDKLGDKPGSAYNLSVSAFQRQTEDRLYTRRTLSDISTGQLRQEQIETGQSRDERMGLNISGRLQWRLGEGESLTLQPVIFVSKGENTTERTLVQPLTLNAAPYAQANSRADSEFGVARLNAQWQKKLGADTRLELRLGGGGYRAENQLLRNEYDAGGRLLRVLDDGTVARESSVTSVGKLSHELVSEHSLVTGWDIEAIQRNETRVTLQNGRSLLSGFGNELDASSRRIALYVQDEWSPNKQWSAYAGLRWERIATESKDLSNPVSQSNAVWTPLFQALWKPNEKSRDQVRVALTRSYKAPTLRNLIARPYLSTRYPVPGPNEASSPDVVGNPNLKPELATGVDLAFEHYLPAGGLLSVNLFHRQISNLIRNVTSLQTVPWDNTSQRHVSQPQNVGDAATQGIELEAKGRLSELNKDWPAVNLRSNLSLFRSRVKGVPGPDNRIDEQAAATANLGADHRFKGLPFTLGANYNWTPAYEVQQTATQRLSYSTKRSFEAFGTWDVNPALKLRLGATNLRPLAYSTLTSIDSGNLRDTSQDINRGRTQWSLRVEMKL